MTAPITSALHPDNIAVSKKVQKLNDALLAQGIKDIIARPNWETQIIQFIQFAKTGTGSDGETILSTIEAIVYIQDNHHLNLVDLLITMIG